VRYWVLAGIIVVVFLLQSVMATYLSVAGITPDFLLVMVVIYGLLFGWPVGLGAGVLGGLLLDLSTSRFIGLHLLALGTVGLLAGFVEEKVFKDNLLLAPTGAMVGSILSQSIVLACLWLFGWEMQAGGVYRAVILPSALYNTFWALLLYSWTYKNYLYLRPDPRGTIELRRH
jgi:rod shape-determining protein MreD